MSNITRVSLLFLIILIIFNKKIVSYYFLKKFSSWVERPVLINEVNFDYSGNVQIKDIKILNLNEQYYENIFKAEKIEFIFDFKSLFTDLILIEKLNIINPEFFLDIKILEKNGNLNEKKTIFIDNIGLAEKLNEKKPDKIWPKKDKDINFIIISSVLTGAKGNVKVSSIQKPMSINMSKMKFNNFGNEKNYRHYKDILKIILFDLYARIENQEFKEILKKIYSF